MTEYQFQRLREQMIITNRRLERVIELLENLQPKAFSINSPLIQFTSDPDTWAPDVNKSTSVPEIDSRTVVRNS